jgi:tetratricopeptide (TPR) repeat protein
MSSSFPFRMKRTLATIFLSCASWSHAQSEPAARSLLEIPIPDAERMDVSVQQQVRDAQARVAQAQTSSREDQSLAYGRLGQVYQAYGLEDAAIPSFKNAQTLGPREFRWPYYLGLIFQRRGDLQQAIESYQTALQLKPNDEVTKLRLGEANLRTNHLEEAEMLYTQIVAANPRSAPALDGLGRLALARGKYGEALELLARALAINPDASYLHYPLAMAYRGLGRLNEARAELAKHGPAAPELIDPYLRELQDLKSGEADLWLLASQQMAQKKFSEAATTYYSLLKKNPDDLVAQTYLGTALARAGRMDDAIQQLSDVLRKSPQNAEAHYCLGVVFARLARDEAAVEQFRATMNADPQFGEVHFQIANVLMRTHHYDEAAQQYAKAVHRNPTDTFAALMEAMALVRIKRFADARSALEQAHSTQPENQEVVNALARLLAAAPDANIRDGKRALELLRQIVTVKESSIDLEWAETIAMALAETGDFAKAAALQRSVIERLERENLAGVEALRGTLALYERGEACRVPWRDDDPIFVPTPNTGDGAPNAQPPPTTGLLMRNTEPTSRESSKAC